jgi:hypothetical protein
MVRLAFLESRSMNSRWTTLTVSGVPETSIRSAGQSTKVSSGKRSKIAEATAMIPAPSILQTGRPEACAG